MKSFEHDTNARNDIKLRRLKKKYGLQGLGAWWIMVEIIGAEGVGGHLEFKKYPIDDFAEEWNMSKEIAKEFISF